MSSFTKRLEKLEQDIIGQTLPCLYVKPYDESKITGYECRGSIVTRRPNESINALEARATQVFKIEGEACLIVAICGWGKNEFEK